MRTVLNHPLVVFAFSFVVMWVSTRIGAYFHKRRWNLDEDERENFGIVQGATLTLLGLVIGFTFSMAVSRYDQRKNYEEAEANAIGTEYVRTDLLPSADAAKIRALLRSYLDQRVLFYDSRGGSQLVQINAATAQLQAELWSAVLAPAESKPTPVMSSTMPARAKR